MVHPTRIRDWVNTPKQNGYESLHVTVKDKNNKWVEIQIRTVRMNEIAEQGYPAHWRYKELGSDEKTPCDLIIEKIAEAMRDPELNAMDFIGLFRSELYNTIVFVTTPKGNVVHLQPGSTVLDFAYTVHKEVGNTALAGKIGHNLVPLNYVLKGGESVEIINSETKRTQSEWKDFVVTAKAQLAIKENIRIRDRDSADNGKKMFDEKFIETDKPLTKRAINKLLEAYELPAEVELYRKIGQGLIQLDEITSILKKDKQNILVKYWNLNFFSTNSKEKLAKTTNDSGKGEVEINGEIFEHQISGCCNPIPGDDAIGIINKTSKTVWIHKLRCQYAEKALAIHAEQTITVEWNAVKIPSFVAKIKLSGMDKHGLCLQIATIISKEHNVNMKSLNLATTNNVFSGIIEIYVHDLAHLEKMMSSLSSLNGIQSVIRIDDNNQQIIYNV
jgi:GTP pyrophosphokinase